MFRDDFWFARVQIQIRDTDRSMRRTRTDARHSSPAEGRRILVGSAQTCQGRRPSLGRANGDAGMTHLVFRVDVRRLRAGRQSDRIKNALRFFNEPRWQHRMKTFPDRSSLPPWLAPAVRARPALYECLEGPHEENVSQRNPGRGVACCTG